MSYLWIQRNSAQTVKRPYHYRQGQIRAIDLLVPSLCNQTVLDIGCGIGTGMKKFQEKKADRVVGVDISPERLDLARRRKLEAYNLDVQSIEFLEHFEGQKFDHIWCSHVFEHFHNPRYALENLFELCTEYTNLYIIVPYPDIDPSPAHPGSKILGLHEEDDGRSVLDFFRSCGLKIHEIRLDEYREPEIWIVGK